MSEPDYVPNDRAQRISRPTGIAFCTACLGFVLLGLRTADLGKQAVRERAHVEGRGLFAERIEPTVDRLERQVGRAIALAPRCAWQEKREEEPGRGRPPTCCPPRWQLHGSRYGNVAHLYSA
jgi:hypothetical protein